MIIDKIVRETNKYLAGEQLTYRQLEPFLNATIDDINYALNSEFPSFSDLSDEPGFTGATDYDYFPDKYIRTIVIIGAAYKFYIMDEEGIQTAEKYGYDYEKGLFAMQRDYIDQVPIEYQSDSTGSLEIDLDELREATPFNFRAFF